MIQHPELDGPFSVATAWSAQTDFSGATYQAPTTFSGNRWNTTPGFYAAHVAALTAYRVTPAPFSRIWAGDNAAAPAITIALAFPDAATATTVLTGCGAAEPKGA